MFIMQYYVMNKQIKVIRTMISCFRYGIYSVIMFVIVVMIGRKFDATVTTTLIQAIVGCSTYVVLLLVTKDKLFYLIAKKIFRRRIKQ